MKAKKPHWDIARVHHLASAGQIVLTETKAKASFPTFQTAMSTARDIIAGLHVGLFAETL